jgi:hypothetical protein
LRHIHKYAHILGFMRADYHAATTDHHSPDTAVLYTHHHHDRAAEVS